MLIAEKNKILNLPHQKNVKTAVVVDLNPDMTLGDVLCVLDTAK